MITLYLILLLAAASCFVLCVLDVRSSRVNFLALGLLFWVAVPLIQTFKVM